MKKLAQSKTFTPNTNLWLAVKMDIEAKIITGEYAAGTKIPTIVELIEQYGIGKTTAQKIITALDDEGVIVKKVGIGCFVKPFVKERLYEQHEQILKTQISNIVAEAALLQLSESHITELLKEEWEKKSSPVI